MADGTEVFHAELTAVDHVSNPLRNIFQALRRADTAARGLAEASAAIRAPHRQVAEGVHRIGRELRTAAGEAHRVRGEVEKLGIRDVFREGLHGVRESFERISEPVGHITEKMAEWAPMLVGLGGLTSVGGIIELVRHTAEVGLELQRTSRITGLSTAQFQQWSYIAKQTEVPVEALTTGLARFNQRVGEVATGRNKNFAALLKHVGISIYDAHGKMRAALPLFLEFAEAMRKTTSAQMQAAMGEVAMGRSWREILPMMIEQPKELRELSEHWKIYGYTLDKTRLDHLEVFKRTWNDLDTAVSGFLTEVGADLAPVLTPIVRQMADWVAANRDWIATDITGSVRWFVTEIQRVYKDTNWTLIFDIFGKFGEALVWVGEHLGIVAIGLTAIAGIKVLAFAKNLLGVAAAFVTFGAAMAPFVLTPAGLWISGIAAGMVALYEAWQHWPEIKQWMKEFKESWFDWSPGAPPSPLEPLAPNGPRKPPRSSVLPPYPGQPQSFVVPWGGDGGGGVMPISFGSGNSRLIGMVGDIEIYGRVLVDWLKEFYDAVGQMPAQFGGMVGAAFGAGGSFGSGFGGGAAARPASASDLGLLARDETSFGLPRGLLDAIWAAESGRGAEMVSPAGALGHFQFMPGTWARYGQGSPFDLGQSALAAARYMRKLLGEFHGNVAEALAGYNLGEDRVEGLLARYGADWWRHLPNETQGYLMKILPHVGAPDRGPPAEAPGRSLAPRPDRSPWVAPAQSAHHQVEVTVHMVGAPPGAQIEVIQRRISREPRRGAMRPGVIFEDA